MNEVLDDKTGGESSYDGRWNVLTELASDKVENYTDEEKEQIAKTEERIAKLEGYYNEERAKLDNLEKNQESQYKQAGCFYDMEYWQAELEERKEDLNNLKEHKPVTSGRPDEKEYLPEEAVELLGNIPEEGNFKVLKNKVRNAYYLTNYKYDKAVKRFSDIAEKRKEYLKEKNMDVNGEEKDFWIFKRWDYDEALKFDKRQADKFLRVASRYSGLTEEPQGLSYALYYNDSDWDLEGFY